MKFKSQPTRNVLGPVVGDGILLGNNIIIHMCNNYNAYARTYQKFSHKRVNQVPRAVAAAAASFFVSSEKKSAPAEHRSSVAVGIVLIGTY